MTVRSPPSVNEMAMSPGDEQLSALAGARRAPMGAKRVGLKLLVHGGALLIAVACFAAYGHFKLEGQSTAAMASLASAAIFGFAPLRDVLRIVFRVEGKALHLAHGLGSLALIGLPVSGVVSGRPVLTHAWMAPFAMMGAAQAVMHQNDPRSAKQAAALKQFAVSLPEVAQFASAKDLTSPANAKRAVAVLSDILAKAQALGETELESDPGFQSALREVSTRFGASLGLDAVDVALRNLSANPAAQGAIPDLQKRLALARKTIGGSAAK
jgi:hypothetical protein